MPVLTSEQLAKMRQALARGKDEVTWDKATVNVAFQGVEDVIEAQALDANTLITETVLMDARAQQVDDALTANRIPVDLVPVIEDWLVVHPTSTTTRAINQTSVNQWLGSNRSVLNLGVGSLPAPVRTEAIQVVLNSRLEAAL